MELVEQSPLINLQKAKTLFALFFSYKHLH
jgi:hypothetical protein